MNLPNWLPWPKTKPTVPPTTDAVIDAAADTRQEMSLAGRRIDDLARELLESLDRIEQTLREMGACDRCGLAHERGVRECATPNLKAV